MKVLIACEFSGIVREAFKACGHDAWSCDLLPTEIPGNHYQCNVLDILNNNWDLMIAHPPCTHLAVSGAAHFYRKKKEQREAFEFVMKLFNANIPHICIENPISIISRLKKPSQIIQPYYFGDPIPKSICLWLKNLPALKFTNMVKPEYIIYNSKKTKNGKSKYSVFGKLGKGHGHERSKFFPGIAKAMAEQWGSVTEVQLELLAIGNY